MADKKFKSKKDLQLDLKDTIEKLLSLQMQLSSIKNVIACVWRGRFEALDDRMLDDKDLSIVRSIEINKEDLLDVYQNVRIEVKKGKNGLLVELYPIVKPEAAPEEIPNADPATVIPFAEIPNAAPEEDLSEDDGY